jgi:hypothetical protein
MKKRILILALALVSISSFSFATDVPGSSISNQVMNSFNREFVTAKDVKWESNKNFTKATFWINDMTLSAYYLPSGEQLAVTRFISTAQLPIQLLTSLKNDYSGYWISDLFELNDQNGTEYYITLENDSQIKVLKSSFANTWSTYKVVEKL